jgi:serine/threonine-protein kinase
VLVPGPLVAGRYTLLQVLGEGGMGVVLAAYDARLDRRVALKLLHPERSQQQAERSRLVREAQAMARLSHPNVVHVYDTGALESGQLFIAMEYVEGTTLRQWCLQQPRTWREVLGAYLEAGRGLVAAHAAGLVHRDFKPDNVLVGRDGRVRVTDFGMASGEPLALSPPLTASAPDASAWEQSLTQPGALVGTLKYMAPELMCGEPANERSDLFAYCIALYEALYRQPAYGGASLQERMGVYSEARGPRPAPAQSEVPAWVERALLQGLEVNPALRPASMGQLLALLEADPEARRRARWKAAGLGGLVVGLMGLALGGWMRAQAWEPPCAFPERRLAGVWDAPVQQRVERALLGTGVAYAPAVSRRLKEALDAYAGRWARLHQEVCEAGRGQSALPANVVALRAVCLERRRNQLGTLTELLSRDADKALVERVVQLATSLPPLEYCQEDSALMAAVPPPEDPALRARVEALQAEMDRLPTLFAVGRFREGAELSERLLQQVAGLGHVPLEARALYETARFANMMDDYPRAEALGRQVLPLAARAGDDALVVEAWNLLMVVVGISTGRQQEALGMRLAMETAMERTRDTEVRAKALNTLGVLLQQQGRYAEARDLHERNLRLREKTLGSRHLHVAGTLNNLAVLLAVDGRLEEALALHQRALSIREEQLGAEHPEVVRTLTNMALLYSDMGRYEEALAVQERSLVLLERQLGAEKLDLGNVLNNLGLDLLALGRLERAQAVFARALDLRERKLGREHPNTVLSTVNMASVLQEQGHSEQALRLYERAMRVVEQTGGGEQPHLILPLLGQARILMRQGQPRAARRHLERARELQEKRMPTSDEVRLDVLLAIGEWHLAERRPAEAISTLEQALKLARFPTNNRAQAQALLAQALWEAGERGARARELATQAHAHYQRLGHAPRLATMTRWLATHALP